MNIIIYDATSLIHYSPNILLTQPVRGTQSSLIRVAHGLAKHHQVTIAHHLLNEAFMSDGVNYMPLSQSHTLSPDAVIVLLRPELAKQVSEIFPKAKKYLWLHNLPQRNFHSFSPYFAKHQWQVIGVSKYHQQRIEERLKGKWYHFSARKVAVPVHAIYNPLDATLHADNTPVKSNQLIFTSIPYKGLSQVLKQFDLLRQHYPEYELLVASPKHADDITLPENASWLPPQAPSQLAKYIRESFCVFYPQTQRVETFGFVYAEANAVGTPVLAHDFGAAKEVLSDPEQVINGNHFDEILTKMTTWRHQRPKVEANPAFKLATVLKSWEKVLAV